MAMVRKQVYIEARQNTLLKRLAKELGVTEAELIRRAIDRELSSGRVQTAFIDDNAWEEARAFREQWVSRKDIQKTEPWSREQLYEELYDERLKQYGRKGSG